MTRLAALDYGSRRIGVAVADAETGIAFARPALVRRRDGTDLARVCDLLHRERASRVVVGLPLLMDGREGRQAAVTRAFGNSLAAAGFEVRYADERLTSWQADADLAAGGRRPARASGERDSAAARIILQEYLADGRADVEDEETQ